MFNSKRSIPEENLEKAKGTHSYGVMMLIRYLDSFASMFSEEFKDQNQLKMQLQKQRNEFFGLFTEADEDIDRPYEFPDGFTFEKAENYLVSGMNQIPILKGIDLFQINLICVLNFLKDNYYFYAEATKDDWMEVFDQMGESRYKLQLEGDGITGEMTNQEMEDFFGMQIFDLFQTYADVIIILTTQFNNDVKYKILKFLLEKPSKEIPHYNQFSSNIAIMGMANLGVWADNFRSEGIIPTNVFIFDAENNVEGFNPNFLHFLYYFHLENNHGDCPALTIEFQKPKITPITTIGELILKMMTIIEN